MKYFLMPGVNQKTKDLFRMYDDTTSDKLNMKTGQWHMNGSMRPADHYQITKALAQEIVLYATMKSHLNVNK